MKPQCRTETSVVLKYSVWLEVSICGGKSNRNKCCIEITLLCIHRLSILVEPKQVLYWNSSTRPLLWLLGLSNRNKCCIEILFYTSSKINFIKVEPKQVLYWNVFVGEDAVKIGLGRTETSVVLKSNLLSTVNAAYQRRTETSVVLKSFSSSFRSAFIFVEPKQVLYWNYIAFPCLFYLLLVEPKQVLYWNKLNFE